MGQPVTITPDGGAVTITPDQRQPSVGEVLTQPTDKTDQEYKGYTGAAGVAGATVKGLDDVARGTRGAVAGMWNTLRHPIDTAKGIAQLPSQAAQVPAAIHDINQSPDPLAHYADAAQDTASQGAGQALTALGTGATIGLAKDAAPYVGPVGKALVKGYAKKIIPGDVGTAFRAVRDAKAAQNPPVYPGASEPAAPPPEITQAAPLAQGGGKPISSPADALGKIPVKGQIVHDYQSAKPSEFNRGSLQDLLQQSMGGKALDPKVPLRQQIPSGTIGQQMKSPIAETPAAQQSGPTSIPEGHTAVDSSALRSYKYDPGANEFHANYKSGNTVHVFGDVSPEEAQAFEQSPSKGQAMQAVKNAHPLVGKIVDGKRIAVKASQ